MDELRFTAPYTGSTQWSLDLPKATSAENLAKIRHVLEERGPVIVVHWHFLGSRAPTRRVFEDFDDFVAYLRETAIAGDALDVWSMSDVCLPNNTLVAGKCPNDKGMVPKGGAY